MREINDEEIWRTIKRVVWKETSPHPEKERLIPEVSLFDIHLRDDRANSHSIHNIINLVHVIYELEERFSVSVEVDEIFELFILQDLFDLLKKKIVEKTFR